MARDLVAKRVVEQYLRKKSKPLDAKGFIELPCCVEAAELQECLERADQQINSQAKEYKAVGFARIQEVDQLAAEVSFLQKQILKQGRIQTHSASDEARLRAEIQAMRHQMELESIEHQLALHERDIEASEQQILQIKWGTASDMAQLTVLQAMHEQEVVSLKRQLRPGRGAESSVEGPVSHLSAEELGKALQAAVTERESMETLLQKEREYRLEEICLLQKELRQVRSSTWLSGPRSDCIALHQSLKRVCEQLQPPRAPGQRDKAENLRNLAQQMICQLETIMEG